MNNKKITIVAILLPLIAFSGCATQTVDSPQPVMIKSVNKIRTMEIAEDVLKSMRFTIEKADTEKGIIKTKPLRGAQLFEFWRKDNASIAATAESSIHSIQRIVHLNIVQGRDTVMLDCQVNIRRLSLPENDEITQTRSAALFTSSSQKMQRLRINPEQARSMERIDLGQDPALETKILQLIQKRISGSES